MHKAVRIRIWALALLASLVILCLWMYHLASCVDWSEARTLGQVHPSQLFALAAIAAWVLLGVTANWVFLDESWEAPFFVLGPIIVAACLIHTIITGEIDCTGKREK